MAKKEKAASTGRKKKSSALGFVVFAPLGLIFFPYTIVLFGGMIPSFVALMADREKQKLTALTVASLNFAAVMPMLVSLWSKGSDMDSAATLLSNPLNWILMFTGAGAGWVLALIVPQLITSVIVMRERRRLTDIRRRQQELVTEWGPEVAEPEEAPR